MERRKRSANQEPVIVLDEEEKMEPIHKLLKLDRDKFKTIQLEMKTKGLVLSQTWSDLYSLMSTYQAELITREDQLIDIESQIDAQRKSAKDNELERMKLQMEAKDREIKTKSKLLAETQNELGRVKSVLRSKEELIRRLQCQVKVDGDSVMTGDSPAALSEQVPRTSITTLTISSPAGIDTSSLRTDQNPSEHVQTNFSRSASDDSGTGAEKTDAKYQMSSSNDEETDSFLVLESDVATVNIPGQDSGVLEEVQPGTSVTDDSGQWKECSVAKNKSGKIKREKFQTDANPRTEDDDIKPLLGYLKLDTVTSRPAKPKSKPDDIKPLMGLTFSHPGKALSARQRTEDATQPRPPYPQTDEIRPLMGGLPGRGGDMYLRKQTAFPCQICGKISYDRSSLNRHMRIHSGSKPYVCSQCGRAFSDSGNRWKHQRRCQRDFN